MNLLIFVLIQHMKPASFRLLDWGRTLLVFFVSPLKLGLAFYDFEMLPQAYIRGVSLLSNISSHSFVRILVEIPFSHWCTVWCVQSNLGVMLI